MAGINDAPAVVTGMGRNLAASGNAAALRIQFAAFFSACSETPPI